MLGLTAAPDIAIAVPSEIFAPYWSEERYAPQGRVSGPALPVPQCRALTVNGAALRSCHASFSPATRFSVRLITWNGCHRLPPGGGQSSHILGSSFGSSL